MDSCDRRKDFATAEKIDMALKTKRAFDTHTAMRFLTIAGVPTHLARNVLERPFGCTRADSVLTGPQERRKRR
ncbi:hypothetical protein [Pseudoduganella sp. GCM10020061]|uniref:hypothetical protein n=1 Tax=Pseudoduganella sp. GCM10020061 TaxID=3317345 RepID=UPI003635AEA7